MVLEKLPDHPFLPRATLKAMVDAIVHRFQPDQVILFGSHARGTPTVESDVDLLIVMDFEGSRRARRIEIREVLRGMGKPKDVVLVTPKEYEELKDLVGTIVHPASNEGIVLYRAAA